MVMFSSYVLLFICRSLCTKKYNMALTYRKVYTVKPAYASTPVKQSPVLKGHIFLVLS